jgi:hypothetical protein
MEGIYKTRHKTTRILRVGNLYHRQDFHALCVGETWILSEDGKVDHRYERHRGCTKTGPSVWRPNGERVESKSTLDLTVMGRSGWSIYLLVGLLLPDGSDSLLPTWSGCFPRAQ